MTAQIPERFRHEGKLVKLCSEPLAAYFEANGMKPTFPWMRSNCWRGYIGEWEIADGQLYLVGLDVEVGRRWHVNMSDEERGVWEALGNMANTPTLEEIFPGKTLPIFADWFSGVLRCGQGDIVNYVHMGYGSNYDNELLISIEKGIVKGEALPLSGSSKHGGGL
ncbi:MAG: hypothetical protein PHP57_07980 [Sideroxydans sp.]|nr:hypothetical protein [Sideroxydans sp.]